MTSGTKANIVPLIIGTAAATCFCPTFSDSNSMNSNSVNYNNIHIDNSFLSNSTYFESPFVTFIEYSEEKKVEVMNSFINEITSGIKDLKPEYAQLVKENLWDLV